MRLLLGGLAAAIYATVAVAAEIPPETWLGSWAHVTTAYNMTVPPPATGPDGAPLPARGRPAYAPLPPYENVTVRELARISVDARRIRVRFSNEYGDKEMHIGGAHIAIAADKGGIVPGSDHVLTFSGKASVTVPVGAPILSDPVDWTLPAFSRLAISVYYPDKTTPPAHTLFTLSAFASSPGDFLASPELPGATPARTGNAASEIDVVPATAKHVVVTFGDSITEGVVSTTDAFRGWADRLAERLQQNPATRDWSVVNAGIGSNRILHDTPGTNALARFDRDVLSVPGVAAIIVLLGINDIQYSHRNAAEAVDAQQMIAGLQQIADRAHAHRLKIFGATITAFEGSPDYTEQGEAARQAVNRWIRTSGAFDGVVDFDAVTRDPARPTHLLASVESSGHLHPSDAGYAVMGDSIDLNLFAGR
jgi:lysophospholipase L1-like esterase